MDIEFTQYLRPDGRTKVVQMDRPEDIVLMAEKILESGKYRFEVEVLMTDQVSVTCFDTEEEEDIAIEISANGPPLPAAIDKMIGDAFDIVTLI